MNPSRLSDRFRNRLSLPALSDAGSEHGGDCDPSCVHTGSTSLLLYQIHYLVFHFQADIGRCLSRARNMADVERTFSFLIGKLACFLDLAHGGWKKRWCDVSPWRGHDGAGGSLQGPPERRQVDGEEVEIAPMEVELLKALMEAAGEPAYLDWASLGAPNDGHSDKT